MLSSCLVSTVSWPKSEPSRWRNSHTTQIVHAPYWHSVYKYNSECLLRMADFAQFCAVLCRSPLRLRVSLGRKGIRSRHRWPCVQSAGSAPRGLRREARGLRGYILSTENPISTFSRHCHVSTINLAFQILLLPCRKHISHLLDSGPPC